MVIETEKIAFAIGLFEDLLEDNENATGEDWGHSVRNRLLNLEFILEGRTGKPRGSTDEPSACEEIAYDWIGMLFSHEFECTFAECTGHIEGVYKRWLANTNPNTPKNEDKNSGAKAV